MNATAPSTLPATGSDAFVYYLFVASGGMTPQMGVSVEFDAHVEEAPLARALRVLLDTEPVMGYRFVPESPGPLWERISIAEGTAVLPVRETSDPEADLHRSLASPFDACAHEQVRGCLLRAPDRDTLALQVSHVAVDGRGSVETLYRLCEIHRRLLEDPGWDPPFDTDSFRDFATAGVPANLIEKASSAKAFMTSLAAGEWRYPPDSGRRGSDPYTVATVGRELLSAIKASGNARGATINDLLLAAYFRSLRSALEIEVGAKAGIGIGADLRRYLALDSGWGLSNYAAFIGLPLVAIEQRDFDAALNQVMERTQALKDRTMRELAVSRVMADRMTGGRKGRFSRPMLARMAAMMGKTMETAGGGTAPVLTNIGEIDAEKVRFGGDIRVQHVRWFVQIGNPASMALGVSSFRGRLDLCASVDPTGIDADIPRAIVSGTVRELEEWVGRESD